MNTQFGLDEFDVETLVNLMLRSQQSRTREALCLRIGVDPRRLMFIKESAEADFVIQLITYLNEIGNKEALCKLCCQELTPIFSRSEKYALILREIAEKLHCNLVLTQNKPKNEQPTASSSIPASTININHYKPKNEQPNSLSSTPTSGVNLNLFNQLAKNKLVTRSTIFLIGLVGLISLFGNKHKSNLPNNPPETLANGSKVRVIAHCEGYYENGAVAGPLKVGGNFPVVKKIHFQRSGKDGYQVLVLNNKTNQYLKVSIANSCLESNEGGVILFN